MNNSRRKTFALCLAALLLTPRGIIAQDATAMAPEAREYLEHVLRIMEAEALNRNSVDWSQIRADAYRVAAGAQHPRDSWRSIAGAVQALSDNHSRFVPAVC